MSTSIFALYYCCCVPRPVPWPYMYSCSCFLFLQELRCDDMEMTMPCVTNITILPGMNNKENASGADCTLHMCMFIYTYMCASEYNGYMYVHVHGVYK